MEDKASDQTHEVKFRLWPRRAGKEGMPARRGT